jgi:hypothetical protein
MSEYYANDKEGVPARPEAAILSGEEKNQQVQSVAESTENSDRLEPEQQGRMARMFTYMKTRDFWIVILLGYASILISAQTREQSLTYRYSTDKLSLWPISARPRSRPSSQLKAPVSRLSRPCGSTFCSI